MWMSKALEDYSIVWKMKSAYTVHLFYFNSFDKIEDKKYNNVRN